METMHWLLDVNFSENQCRTEDKNIHQNLNNGTKIGTQSDKEAERENDFRVKCLTILDFLKGI